MNTRLNLLPIQAMAFLAMARSKKAQGSLEYIMMIAAASIVIVLAVAMVVKLKGAVVTSVSVNGTNESIAQAISKELGSLTSNAVQ
ncbi:MAG: hypothetical protein ACP5MC_01110 [Candidatus Micrarchaeia archaeon]